MADYKKNQNQDGMNTGRNHVTSETSRRGSQTHTGDLNQGRNKSAGSSTGTDYNQGRGSYDKSANSGNSSNAGRSDYMNTNHTTGSSHNTDEDMDYEG